jgi:hypothetical protein
MSLLAYITLEDAKRQCSIVTTDTRHDDLLMLYINAASQMVKNHLGDKSVYRPPLDDDDEPEYDSNWEPILQSFDSVEIVDRVRPEVKVAVCMLVAELFRNREGEGSFERGYLPAPVASILYPLRDPQLK